jgi:hypothetical protein
MTRVERLVVVVDANHEHPELEAFTYKRYAETTDGLRIDDPRWRLRGSTGVLFEFGGRSPEARAAHRREMTIQMVLDRRPNAADRDTEPMLAALREAGAEMTADELLRLPTAVEFTAAADTRMLDAAAGRLPEPSAHAPPPSLRARGIAQGAAIVLGAMFPRLNRYRIWQRQSPRGRLLSFLADWLVGAAAGARRARRRSSRY